MQAAIGQLLCLYQVITVYGNTRPWRHGTICLSYLINEIKNGRLCLSNLMQTLKWVSRIRKNVCKPSPRLDWQPVNTIAGLEIEESEVFVFLPNLQCKHEKPVNFLVHVYIGVNKKHITFSFYKSFLISLACFWAHSYIATVAATQTSWFVFAIIFPLYSY